MGRRIFGADVSWLLGGGGLLLDQRESWLWFSPNRIRHCELWADLGGAMNTCNDKELNELLVRAAQLLPLVSEDVRRVMLGSALTKGSELEWVVKRLNWRIWDLTGKGDSV